jgi:hypothetical protein
MRIVAGSNTGTPSSSSGRLVFDLHGIADARDTAHVRIGIKTELTAKRFFRGSSDLWIRQRTERPTTSKYQDLYAEPTECLSQLDANDARSKYSH